MSRFLSMSISPSKKSPSGQAAYCVKSPLYTASIGGRTDPALHNSPSFQNQALLSGVPQKSEISSKPFTKSFAADIQNPETGKKQKNLKISKKTFDRIFESIISATETKNAIGE